MLIKTVFKLSIIIISLFIIIINNSESIKIYDNGERLNISNLENSFLHRKEYVEPMPYIGLIDKTTVTNPVFEVEINIEN